MYQSYIGSWHSGLNYTSRRNKPLGYTAMRGNAYGARDSDNKQHNKTNRCDIELLNTIAIIDIQSLTAIRKGHRIVNTTKAASFQDVHPFCRNWSRWLESFEHLKSFNLFLSDIYIFRKCFSCRRKYTEDNVRKSYVELCNAITRIRMFRLRV